MIAVKLRLFEEDKIFIDQSLLYILVLGIVKDSITISHLFELNTSKSPLCCWEIYWVVAKLSIIAR